jgi:hypothetical protein
MTANWFASDAMDHKSTKEDFLVEDAMVQENSRAAFTRVWFKFLERK